jgi:hypothetical protein
MLIVIGLTTKYIVWVLMNAYVNLVTLKKIMLPSIKDSDVILFVMNIIPILYWIIRRRLVIVMLIASTQVLLTVVH